MAGVGKRIEEAVKALDQKQLKKALYLTDKPKMERHHGWVEDATRTCLAHKDDPKICDQAIRAARDKLASTITLPMDSVDLEGIESYLMHQTREENPVAGTEAKKEMTDEELYAHCDVCHVADAAVKFVAIAEEDECDLEMAMGKLQPCVDNEMTTPEAWIKTMVEVAEQATCHKDQYGSVLTELTEYLQKENSEILKNLDSQEGQNEQATVISP